MKSILEIPADVISQFTAVPEEFWLRVSNYLFAQALEHAHDHLLVRVHRRFDFSVVVKKCQAYRLYAGQRGQEADFSLEQLCRALVVRYLNHWSLRQTCEEIKSNLLLRWFVGFLLNEQTPSYVTMQRFEEWVKIHEPRLFFNEILRQIDQDFPEDAAHAQVGDTFALLARTTPQSRTQMLRNAGRKVLFYLEQVEPSHPHTRLAAHCLTLSLVMTPIPETLFGLPDAPREQWLTKEERDELEVRTAQAADGLLQQVEAHLVHFTALRTLEAEALRRWVGILRKLVTDEFVIERDATGAAVAARHCTPKERGSFVLGSTVDPEATFRKHGEKNDLGYNVQVGATDKFIREIFAETGATNDSSGVAPLVANQIAQTGMAPSKLIYDRAAGSPKLFHDVAQASEGRTQLVARLIDHSKSSERFGPTDFTLNEDGSLTCPNGQESRKFYRAPSGDGYTYRFSAAQCQGCPLWQRCRGDDPASQPDVASTEPASAEPGALAAKAASAKPRNVEPTDAASTATEPLAPDTKAKSPKVKKAKTPKPTAFRQVFISAYRDWQRSAILYIKTPAFKLDMNFRSTVERHIAGLVRYNGARHANGYGVRNADFQVRMAALAFNLKRWAVLTKAKDKRHGHPEPDSS